ncbi:14871_t:CDS:1 [Dentiscutata erythropus]|uniref:14871_t:CDS:1 n=1 Tax=Dentiscutata erythropus TaxID=1348616 RepID=A0A9N8ZA22_9GLOM|nr:14871_t:CDS:1 [Dentiscutata erythropus]
MSRQNSKPSVCFCNKHTIETMRSVGQAPTLTQLNQAITSEAKYNKNWSAATTLFQDLDKLVWKRLARLDNMSMTENLEKLTLTQLWFQTPVALRPLNESEIKYIRRVYQIMVRYSPTVNDATKYYLHLLTNHLDTPIFDDECISHCLISLIYLISKSNDVDFMEKGLELIQMALDRNLNNKQLEVLIDVSKEIFEYYGLCFNQFNGLIEESVFGNQGSIHGISNSVGRKKSGRRNNRSFLIPKSDLMNDNRRKQSYDMYMHDVD